MLNILIVEDDPKVAAVLRQGLQESGMTTAVARSGNHAIEQLESQSFDMMLLDLGLPDCDGTEVLARAKKLRPNLPVIVVTARDDVGDKVAGLEAGADDYLVKPFAFTELLARIHALNRRSRHSEGQTLRVGDLSIDLVRRHVERAGQHIDLTPREFDILAYLAQNPAQAVSREMLVRDVWHITSRVTSMDNVLDVHLAHLRDKLDRPFARKILTTIRGVGFMLDVPR